MAATVTISWSPHPRLSAIHAAYVVAGGGRCVDAKIERLIVAPVTELNNRLLSAAVDIGSFWRRLIVEVASDRGGGERSDGAACEIALAAAGLSELQLETTAQGVARLIGECRSRYASRFPKLSEQLRLRSRPLKERWDAFGKGLLRAIAQRIWDGEPPSDWWPPRVEGLLIQPVRGGAGGFDADAQQFWIEAMLTDAEPSIPEVLRVAWLITRMAIEAHTREKSGEHSRRLPWSFASVPIVLAAAADLEVVSPQTPPIQQAMRLWQLGDDAIAETVERWWQQNEDSSVAMPVALKALERMLHSADRVPLDGALR